MECGQRHEKVRESECEQRCSGTQVWLVNRATDLESYEIQNSFFKCNGLQAKPGCPEQPTDGLRCFVGP